MSAAQNTGANATAGQNSAVVDSSEKLSTALRVGHQVIAQKQGAESRFRLELAGWSTGKYLIMGCPRNLLVSGHVSSGDILVIRYILRGVVYAFACQAMHVIFEPPLVLVGWPRDLSALPLTQEKRVSVQIPATIECEEEDQPPITLLATVTDLSQGGCQVEAVLDIGASMPTEAGSKVRLTMNLGQGKEPDPIAAEVRNAMNTGGKLVLGIKFDDDSNVDVGRIAQHYLGVE